MGLKGWGKGRMDQELDLQGSVLMDMTDGVMSIRPDGFIAMVNPAALSILEKEREELVGQKFAFCFFGDARNDGFNQTLLNTVYNRLTHEVSYTTYYTGDKTKQLRIVSSLIRKDENNEGVILVISDITELVEMRDAVKAMEKIRALNHQLERRSQLIKQTFGRYLSDSIVEEILDKPGGLELGGRKEKVTILMSDLRSFSQLCDRMEPEDLLSMLNHYFSEMYEEISRNRGAVIEFLGDGLFVAFGVPAESANHALDAVRAAVGMQKRMSKVNRWNEEHGFPRLSMGIGINTDEAVVGNIGSRRRTKYGVLGSAVNLAGRLESFTTGGQILISPSTRRLTEGMIRIGKEFTAVPKGFAGEILVTQVTGVLGPEPLLLDVETPKTQNLREPEKVRFCRIDGKRVASGFFPGEILAISAEEAVLRTEEKLERYENLLLKFPAEKRTSAGDLYGKVTRTGQEGEKTLAVLAFTGVPAGFEDWIKECCRRSEEG